MLDCSLEVTIMQVISDSNPYYGKIEWNYLVKDCYSIDYDDRPYISPFGVKAKVKLKDEVIRLRVTNHYLNYDGDAFYATFVRDCYIYRLDIVWKNDEIVLESSSLAKYNIEDYLNGLDDKVIRKVFATDFEKIEPLP